MSTNATTGRLLVRPTIWPRLYSGDFFSTKSQIAAAPDTDTKIELANTLVSSGVVLTDNTITVAESGLYRFDVNCQIASTNSSEKSLVIWYKKSSNNVPFSAVRQSLATNVERQGACALSFAMRKAIAFTSDRYGRARGYDRRRLIKG